MLQNFHLSCIGIPTLTIFENTSTHARKQLYLLLLGALARARGAHYLWIQSRTDDLLTFECVTFTLDAYTQNIFFVKHFDVLRVCIEGERSAGTTAHDLWLSRTLHYDSQRHWHNIIRIRCIFLCRYLWLPVYYRHGWHSQRRRKIGSTANTWLWYCVRLISYPRHPSSLVHARTA